MLLAWSNLVNVGTGMGGIILEMTGHMRLKLANSVMRLGMYLGFSVLLIPRWGIVGAAAAVLASEGIINLTRLVQVYILFRLLPYNRTFLKPIAAGLVTLVVAGIMSRWLLVEANPLVQLAIYGLIILAVYVGVFLVLGLPPEEQAVWKRVHRRISAVRSKLSRAG